MEEERFETLAKVASLYYEEGWNQEQIAAQLGYSRAHISRLLSEARREGIVEIRVHHPLERAHMLEQRLQAGFQLHQVRVLQGGELAYVQMLRRLGALAARLLVETIKPDSILGISWGTALSEVVHALPSMDLSGVKVVQLIGSATSRDHQVDGPGLARDFSLRFGGQYFTLAAPWLVRDKRVRDALVKEERMCEILSMAQQADIALVGIGSVEPGYSSLVRAGYITLDQLRELQKLGVVGDVCGHHFDLAGNLVDISMVGYAIGIDANTLRGIPLVIGVAGGVVKAQAILGALRARLINALVTDDSAARGVLDLIEQQSAQR
jgi:DNA-binding transcriptional regulator LsrR (DeoR family)